MCTPQGSHLTHFTETGIFIFLLKAAQHLLLSLKPINFWHRLRPSKFVTSACGALNSFRTTAAAEATSAAIGVELWSRVRMGICSGADFCWLTRQMINMLTGPHLLFVAALGRRDESPWTAINKQSLKCWVTALTHTSCRDRPTHTLQSREARWKHSNLLIKFWLP